jgi:type II secretory ATPase GspE/PulE/Tfp pilus assembly ATPase PilB-like protein
MWAAHIKKRKVITMSSSVKKDPVLPVVHLKVKRGSFIRVVEEMVHLALIMGAEEIIILPPDEGDKNCTVLFNKGDGEIRPMATFPKAIFSFVVSRFKIIGDLDIAKSKISQVSDVKEESMHRVLWNYLIFIVRNKTGEEVHALFRVKNK